MSKMYDEGAECDCVNSAVRTPRTRVSRSRAAPLLHLAEEVDGRRSAGQNARPQNPTKVRSPSQLVRRDAGPPNAQNRWCTLYRSRAGSDPAGAAPTIDAMLTPRTTENC